MVSARASHVRAMSFGHPKNEKRDYLLRYAQKQKQQNHDTTVIRASVTAQANLPMRELVRTPPYRSPSHGGDSVHAFCQVRETDEEYSNPFLRFI